MLKEKELFSYSNLEVVVTLSPNGVGHHDHDYSGHSIAVLESEIVALYSEHCRSHEIGSMVFDLAKDIDQRKIIRKQGVDIDYIIQADEYVRTKIYFLNEATAVFGLCFVCLSVCLCMFVSIVFFFCSACVRPQSRRFCKLIGETRRGECIINERGRFDCGLRRILSNNCRLR